MGDYDSWSDDQLEAEMVRFLPEHPKHQVARQVLNERRQAQKREDEARHREDVAQADRHHSERQRWTRFATWVAFLSALVALASFLAGRFLTAPQVSSLERRVSALEQQLSAAPPNPKPTVSPPPTTAPPIQSTPTLLPVPSGSRSTPADERFSRG